MMAMMSSLEQQQASANDVFDADAEKLEAAGEENTEVKLSQAETDQIDDELSKPRYGGGRISRKDLDGGDTQDNLADAYVKSIKAFQKFGGNGFHVDKISMGQSLSDNEKETIHDMNPEEKQAMMTGMSYEGMRQRYPDRAGQGMTETQQKNLEDFEKTGHLPDTNVDKKPNGDMKPTAVNEIDPSSTNLNPTSQNGVQNGNNLSQPNDGGVDVQVDGHNVHLQPGTSMTIGKDGQISISSNQFNPSTATSTSFPGTAAGNDPAFSSVDPQTSAGVVAGNVSRQVSAQSTNYELGSRVQKADKLRDYYSQKGMSTTGASLGNQQTTVLSSALQDKDKQNSASLGLNVDKNNEMTL